ncbi:hypothetical protein QTN47_04905 [Danxiaibacter flavus]|uniref:Cupin domain-containing protein n=1 Tax=Danxiaibacter flavus TaxID=3049108 RepID=A0ABV3ZCL1_9BACT|nr:hypothetical protein QNM32_04905 [Chitinophagaceae bacterium DXS]
MQLIKTFLMLNLLASVLFLNGCGETANTLRKETKDTLAVATVDTAFMPNYNPAMDSYIMGGTFVKKLGDTLGIKVYEFTLKPGETCALHAHPDHTAYVLQGGKVALYTKATGRRDTLTFPTGMALISGPLIDSGTNIGNTTIKFLITDIYRPRKL